MNEMMLFSNEQMRFLADSENDKNYERNDAVFDTPLLWSVMCSTGNNIEIEPPCPSHEH